MIDNNLLQQKQYASLILENKFPRGDITPGFFFFFFAKSPVRKSQDATANVQMMT
jgi:hypothetical protein